MSNKLKFEVLSIFVYIYNSFNPLMPSVAYLARLAKILISISEDIMKKKKKMSVSTMSR